MKKLSLLLTLVFVSVLSWGCSEEEPYFYGQIRSGEFGYTDLRAEIDAKIEEKTESQLFWIKEKKELINKEFEVEVGYEKDCELTLCGNVVKAEFVLDFVKIEGIVKTGRVSSSYSDCCECCCKNFIPKKNITFYIWTKGGFYVSEDEIEFRFKEVSEPYIIITSFYSGKIYLK
jgi:hypothetical protein